MPKPPPFTKKGPADPKESKLPFEKKKKSKEPSPTGNGWYHDTANHLKRER